MEIKLNYKMYSKIFGLLMLGLFLVNIVFISMGAAYNYYRLWSEKMHGEQILAKADGTRKIAILEASAKRDSARALADAEIIRAQGVAEANKIIGDSLRGNESYLRYLWVQSLDHTNNKVIYVPTEANLPILEASRNK